MKEAGLQRIPYGQAFQNLRRNPVGTWPTRNEENRLEPICKPGFTPSFTLTPGERIFTIGSCFARNVEAALAARGFEIVTGKILDGNPEFAQFGPNILNNYGVPSIYNDLNWALSGQEFDEAANFFETMPGRFIDIHLNRGIRPAPLDVVRRRRAAIRAVTQQVVDCSAVVMTLGLAEVWFDTATGLYLNHVPPKMLFDRFPDRFELHVLDYETTLTYLRRSIALLRTHCHSDQKVLITVSPVPYKDTFTCQDVLVANCYSKSLLRTVADVVANENAHVDYFPSYESVTLSDRKLAWREDMIHVEMDVTRANVTRMVQAYTKSAPDSVGDLQEALTEAQEYLSARNPKSAIAKLEPFAKQLKASADRLFYVDLCTKVGRHDDALQMLKSIPDDVGGWRRRISEARCLQAIGEIDTALSIVQAVVAEQPNRPLPWQALAEIRQAQGLWDEAIAAVKGWADIAIRSGEPFRVLAEIYRAAGKLDSARDAYRRGTEREVSSPTLMLDYAAFLIDQGDLGEARLLLDTVTPDSRAQRERLDDLRIFTL